MGIVNGGQFRKGQEPWNKGKKGIHLSPGTEWKKEHERELREARNAS